MNKLIFLLVSLSVAVTAAPKLRLETAAVVVQIAPGATPTQQTISAFNMGDGALSLSIAISPRSTWLAASVGTPVACGLPTGSIPCIPLTFLFNTAGLARGIYTAAATVSDPNAVDAPQVVTVTVQVGVQPTSIDQYIAPGKTSNIQLTTTDSGICYLPHCPADPNATTQSGGSWLSVLLGAQGTIRFLGTYSVQMAASSAMTAGTYTGSVAVASTTDNYTIPVTMRVTTQPIAVPSTTQITLRAAQGGPPLTYPFLPYISLTNSGLGNLSVQGVSASGTAVSAYDYNDLAIVTVDPGSLGPGLYTDGVVNISCNAANCPIQVPVSLEIVPQGTPLIQYAGVVDNATFDSTRPVAPGDICIVRGEQFSQHTPASASSTPLPSTLGGAQVLVNGVPAPLFYSSAGQLAFQVPSSTAAGTAQVQVVRDGLAGNVVTVGVAARAPGLVVVTDTTYNRIDATHPASGGQTIILWAIGLGATSPAVTDGATAPAGTLAMANVAPSVNIAGSNLTPTFAGLAPGSVGLYQVIVTLPAGLPTGTSNLTLNSQGVLSNSISIAVQ